MIVNNVPCGPEGVFFLDMLHWRIDVCFVKYFNPFRQIVICVVSSVEKNVFETEKIDDKYALISALPTD